MTPLSVPPVSVGNRGRTGVDMFTHHLIAAIRALSTMRVVEWEPDDRLREQKKRWFLVPPVLGAQGDFCLVDLGDPSQDRSTKSPERKREQKKRWFLVPRPTANLPTVLGAQGDFCLVDQIRANPTKALLPPVDFLPWRHAKPGCELASASNEVEESVSRR